MSFNIIKSQHYPKKGNHGNICFNHFSSPFGWIKMPIVTQIRLKANNPILKASGNLSKKLLTIPAIKIALPRSRIVLAIISSFLLLIKIKPIIQK